MVTPASPGPRRAVVAALTVCAVVAVGAQKPRDPLPGEPLGGGGEAIFPVL
jgi:hypothetical protein